MLALLYFRVYKGKNIISFQIYICCVLNVIIPKKRVIFTFKMFLLDEFLGIFWINNKLLDNVSIGLIILIESKGIYKNKGINGVYCYTFYLH